MIIKMKTKQIRAALGVAALTMAGTAFAADEPKDTWQFGVSVPLWAPQINGDATIRGHQQNVNVSFSELKDHLDASFALGLNANKGKFGMFGNVGYMKFTGGNANMNDELKFLVANGGVSYLLFKTETEHPFVLAGTAGVRYFYVENSLGVAPGVLPPPLRDGFTGSRSFNVVDPVIGLRGSQYLTRKFHLDFSGDGGGFDINNSTDWTWSAMGAATYDFARWFSLSAGYQALALDESKGSGRNKNGVNLIFNGVLVVATFKF
jgi:hypothetical protein